MLALVVGVLLQDGRLVVERGLGSGLGPGTIATLNFANRIVALTPALVVGPVSTVLYPLLNRRVIASQLDEAGRLVVRGTRLVMVVAIPAAVALGFLAQP